MVILVWRLYAEFHQQVGFSSFGEQKIEPPYKTLELQPNHRASLPLSFPTNMNQPPIPRHSLALPNQVHYASNPQTHQNILDRQQGFAGASSPQPIPSPTIGFSTSPGSQYSHEPHNLSGMQRSPPQTAPAFGGFGVTQPHTTQSNWPSPSHQMTAPSPVRAITDSDGGQL